MAKTLRQQATELLVARLANEGDRILRQCVEERDYTHRTYNLYDSYGYGVYVGGKLMRSGFLQRSPQATEPRKWYGENFQVLKDCTASVEKGEVVVVCGPSGSGKSTLIKTVNGLEPFQEGRIIVNGIDVGNPKTNLPKLRQHIGMVFQHFELFPHLSIIDNLTLAQMKVLGRSRDEATERGLGLLERVHLSQQALKFPGQLSGGQQQRVAIARALAMDPVCMLFDEPTSALDPEMINEVLDVMVELAQDGMTMMVVTHEMGFARRVADRVLFMESGEILENAPTQEFFTQPKSERAVQFLSKILNH